MNFSPRHSPATHWQRKLLLLIASGLFTVASAQQPQPTTARGNGNGQMITPNFKETDLGQIVDAVAQVTGKTFIISPQVRAQVTILSSTPMSPAAFYEAFLSILQVHGFAAMPSGNVIKIVPETSARILPGDDLPDHINSTSDAIVTQVIALKSVSASALVPLIRQLVSQNGGQLSAVQTANLLIITDRASNVARMIKIIQRIDQVGDDSVDIITLENSSSAEIVRVVNALNTAGASPESAGLAAKVVADDRSNSVLITGEKSQRLRLKTLVLQLDTPLKSGPEVEVLFIRFADAEKLAGKIKEQLTGLAAVAGAPPAGAAAGGGSERSASIWADKDTNAIVITGPLKVRKQLKSIIDKLDYRPAQVKVDAILVEMSFQKSAEFGFNWIVGPSKGETGIVPVGIFNQSVGGTNIGQLGAAAVALQNGSSSATTTTVGTDGSITTHSAPTNTAGLASLAGAIPQGVTMGAGRIAETGINFVTLLRALRGDGHTNVISTPTIVTVDNVEGKIEVAQEVPFLTGQYANTGTAGGGGVTPFQTINRQKVGTILKITPQITLDDAVILKVDQEASSLAQGTQGAVDLITNTRKITTKVIVEDGGMVVLGGLTSNDLKEGENRVPLLGSIPLIGQLFKTRNVDKRKTNLMIFIHPTVLRDDVQTATETNAKYNAIRDEQRTYKKGKVTLLPGDRQPSLEALDSISRYADPNTVPAQKSKTDGELIDTRQYSQKPVNSAPTTESTATPSVIQPTVTQPESTDSSSVNPSGSNQ